MLWKSVGGMPDMTSEEPSGEKFLTARAAKILQTIALTKGLPQQLTVSASGFDTGVFVYSIVVRGKVLASKKMIIIH